MIDIKTGKEMKAKDASVSLATLVPSSVITGSAGKEMTRRDALKGGLAAIIAAGVAPSLCGSITRGIGYRNLGGRLAALGGGMSVVDVPYVISRNSAIDTGIYTQSGYCSFTVRPNGLAKNLVIWQNINFVSYENSDNYGNRFIFYSYGGAGGDNRWIFFDGRVITSIPENGLNSNITCTSSNFYLKEKTKPFVIHYMTRNIDVKWYDFKIGASSSNLTLDLQPIVVNGTRGGFRNRVNGDLLFATNGNDYLPPF